MAAGNGSQLLAGVSQREGVFLVSGVDGECVTYKEMHELIRRVAARFRSDGLRAGSKVIVFAPTMPESVLVAVSAFCAGLTVVPLDYTWPAPPLKYVVEQLQPTHLFCWTGNAGVVAESGFQGRVILLEDGQSASGELHMLGLAQWLGGPAEEGISPAHPAGGLILFTSGSTGRPKGVVLSCEAVCRSGQLVVDTFGWQSTDCFLNLGDLHTMSGFRNTCVAPLLAGCTIIAAPPQLRDSVFSVLALAERYRCTILGAGPHFIRQLNLYGGGRDSLAPSLRQILCTGGFLSPEDASGFTRDYEIPLINYYGLTETCGLCSADLEGNCRATAGNIGHPVDSRMEVVDAEGHWLPDMQIGELRVGNDRLMGGYYGDPEGTSQVLRDGWFYTGDLACRHPDGSFVLKGRKKNMINNRWTDVVHFEEVEMALNDHPDVHEAGVCSRLSGHGQEQLVAFIVSDKLASDPEVGAQTIREFLTGKIGPRKVPAAFTFVEALPHTTTGKLKRAILEDWVHAGLSQERD